MGKIKFTLMSIAFIMSSLWACPSPANMEGVAFTDGEKLNLEKLMEMGMENVNYIKEGEPPYIGVKYLSHYDSRAFVFIGTYGMSHQNNMHLNCMGVIFPYLDTIEYYSHLEKETFDFAMAVKKELEWLVYNGIIDLSSKKIEEIDSALSNAVNGGLQYWTHAKSILSYNSWYVFDSVNGVWFSQAVDGVRSVKGGCSVVYPGDGIPPEPIGISSVIKPNIELQKFSLSSQKQVVRALNREKVKISFSVPVKEEMSLSLYDCRGVRVVTKKVPIGVTSLFINGLKEGYYIFRLSRR